MQTLTTSCLNLRKLPAKHTSMSFFPKRSASMLSSWPRKCQYAIYRSIPSHYEPWSRYDCCDIVSNAHSYHVLCALSGAWLPGSDKESDGLCDDASEGGPAGVQNSGGRCCGLPTDDQQLYDVQRQNNDILSRCCETDAPGLMLIVHPYYRSNHLVALVLVTGNLWKPQTHQVWSLFNPKASNTGQLWHVKNCF